jgi:hypothetical protein
MYMLSTKTRVKKKQVNRVKTPTHILLFADSKTKAMEILSKQNKSLSGFLQEKLDELVQSSKKKEAVYIQCSKYENVIPLDPNQDPYDYNHSLKTVPSTDDEAEISLSFSGRQRLSLDSI